MYAWLSKLGWWCKWNTEGLYRFRPRVPYVQCEIGGLYCLALKKVLVVGGVHAGCERGLSPKSRLCVVDRALLATLRENSLGVWWSCVVCMDEPELSGSTCLGCEPWLPFYSLKGRRVFTCEFGDFLCWVVKPQSRPCRGSPIPSLRYGWQYGCSCGGLPSPVGVVGVGSVILQPVTLTVKEDIK